MCHHIHTCILLLLLCPLVNHWWLGAAGANPIHPDWFRLWYILGMSQAIA